MLPYTILECQAGGTAVDPKPFFLTFATGLLDISNSVDQVRSLAVRARVLKNRNVVIVKLQDLAASLFDSIGVSSILPALLDCLIYTNAF